MRGGSLMKKILTLVVDGLGYSDKENGNAWKNAKTPNLDSMFDKYPHSLLEASGVSVGQPEGQVGNETVGYLTLASGQILKQRSSFVRDFVETDNLATNTELKAAVEHVKKHQSTIHIIGLMSDGGISSSIDDIIKIIDFLKTQEVEVGIDFIADGRDVESKSALKYIEMLENTGVPIFSIAGRYYAMDDEQKWDRTRIYYDLIRNGIGLKIKEVRLALKNCYIRNITDEFLPPMILEPDRNIKDNDVIFWVNYKEDGARQILMSLTNPDEISDFQTRRLINTKTLVMYPIDSKIDATVLINEDDLAPNSLGIYLSKLGLTQARIATKDSYDLATYYFNGANNEKVPKCNNYLVDVPKTIPGKDLELDTAGVVKQTIKCMEKDTDFILTSISALGSISKSGNFKSTVEMVEFIDGCIGKILESAELNFYTIVFLSTYGSVEEMLDEENKPMTIHTSNKVPFVMTDEKLRLSDGELPDVAPTILSYMDISVPESMKKSKNLIED